MVCWSIIIERGNSPPRTAPQGFELMRSPLLCDGMDAVDTGSILDGEESSVGICFKEVRLELSLSCMYRTERLYLSCHHFFSPSVEKIVLSKVSEGNIVL